MGGACVKNGVQIRTDNHHSEEFQSEEDKESQPTPKASALKLQPPNAEARTVSSDIQKIKTLKMQRRKSSNRPASHSNEAADRAKAPPKAPELPASPQSYQPLPPAKDQDLAPR